MREGMTMQSTVTREVYAPIKSAASSNSLQCGNTLSLNQALLQ